MKGVPGHRPPFETIAELRPRTPDKNCSFLAAHSQHVVGLVVHRGLATAYANVVDDPEDADLRDSAGVGLATRRRRPGARSSRFFVPDHFTARVAKTDAQRAAAEQLCAVLGAAWRDHQCGNQPLVRVGPSNLETPISRSIRGLFGSFLDR